MAFARFNPCQPCCNCSFEISYATSGGVQIPGITIEVRDVHGSGVGTCVTTTSGCSIPIKHPGTYYAYNNYCGTTQKFTIAKCGNDVNVVIPNNLVSATVHSECFFDAPLTQFDFSGPKSYTTQASGNALIGSLPFPQRAARGFMPGPIPSGSYTLTVSDVEGNHYSKTIEFDATCTSFNSLDNIFLIKKWGYRRAPRRLTAAGCPAPGITVSDSDGHSATTDANGLICDVWKYDFPDEYPDPRGPYTIIHVTKGGYIDPCGDDGCEVPRPRCGSPLECDSQSIALPEYNVLMPPGYWGSPSDDCLEEQPDELTLTSSGFSIGGAYCRAVFNEEGDFIGVEPVPDSGFTTNSIQLTRTSPYISWPYSYAWPPTGGVLPDGSIDPNPWICGGSAAASVYPGCRKDINASFPNGHTYVNSAIGYSFPLSGFAPRYSWRSSGTSACPTMFTVEETATFWNGSEWETVPTGRSVTISS